MWPLLWPKQWHERWRNQCHHQTSEFLENVSLLMVNNTHFPKTLDVTFSEHLPHPVSKYFVKNDKYTLYSAGSPAPGRIISEILKQFSEQNLSLWSLADLNSTVSPYISIWNSAQQIYTALPRPVGDHLATEYKNIRDPFALTALGNRIGVLDGMVMFS